MTVLFYRIDAITASEASATPEVEVRLWRPAEEGLPPRGSRRLSNLVWWAFTELGVFSRRRFVEVTLWREGRLAHRLIVTPPWWRFPFMAADDLQVGDLWTAPSFRRCGLARAAMAEAHREVSARAGRLWYLADERNPASAGLAASFGYACVGIGERTRPFGLSLLGRFRIVRPGPPAP